MSSNLVNQRVNFATVKSPMPYPDFLDVQLKSFKDFLQLDTPPEKRKTTAYIKSSQRTSQLPIRVITSFWSSLIIILIPRAIQLKSV